jgi:hypothetical protein
MSSHGAWCNTQGCLRYVEISWDRNRCVRCRGYFCSVHLVYPSNLDGSLCLDCLEAVTQERLAADV